MTSDGSQDQRAQYQSAAAGFLGLLSSLTEDDWSRPGLGVWTVRDLAGHTSRALLTVESYLDVDHTTDNPSVADAAAYYRPTASAHADPSAVAERGRAAGAALGDQPADAVAGIVARVLALVDDSPDNALVHTPFGTMTLAGYLPTRTFELVVHTLDLAAAVGADVPPGLTGPLAGCLQLAARVATEQDQAVDVLLALTGRRPLPAGFSIL